MDRAARIINAACSRRKFLAAGVGAPLLLGMTRKAQGTIGLLGGSPGTSSGGGVVISGSTVTITRSAGGFGNDSAAVPAYWNNFGAAALGDTPAQVGLYQPSGEPSPTIVNDQAYPGTTQSMKYVYDVATGPLFPEVGLQFSTGSTALYMSAWIRWSFLSGSTSVSPIWKLSRGGGLGGSDPVYYHGEPQFYLTMRPDLTNGTVTGGDRGYVTDSGVTVYTYANGAVNGMSFTGPSADTWVFAESIYLLSTPGQYDGLLQLKFNAQDAYLPPCAYLSVGTPVSITYGGTRDAGSTNLNQWCIHVFDGIGDAVGSNSNQYALWGEGFYIAQSLRRVVFTNNAVYQSSSKFANQIITNWSDTQITADLNSAGFSSGETVYAHVFTPGSTAANQEFVTYSTVLP